MSGRDGTGPAGSENRGRGQRRSSPTRGRGQWIGNQGSMAGECICPICGATASHQQGIPCSEMVCHKCRQPMIRQ